MIHHLFQFPGTVAKRRQPHHARATFERVEGAAHIDQRVLIALACVAARLGDAGFHGGQHCAGFFEENFEHFAISACGRWCWGGRGCIGRHDSGRQCSSGCWRMPGRGLDHGYRLRAFEQHFKAGLIFVAGEENVDCTLCGFFAVQTRFEIEPQAAETLGKPFDAALRLRIRSARAAFEQMLASAGQPRRALLV